MAKSPTEFTVGSTVSFVTGPTRIAISGATVTGHDGQFVITKDSGGKERRIRPGAITA